MTDRELLREALECLNYFIALEMVNAKRDYKKDPALARAIEFFDRAVAYLRSKNGVTK